MSKYAQQNAIKRNSTLLALLGCTALALPLQAEAAISAKTSWAVSRVASASQGSYCTMAQKYADDTVLTLAQNTKGEYSLALDFKNGQFKTGQKQSVGLSVDGGKAKSYDVMPQSANTAVIGIGKDADLIKKIAASEKITVKINNDTSDFALSEFQSGQKELSVCMEALQKPAGQAAKKVDTASAKPKMNDVKPSSGVNNNEPSVEGLLAAAPKSSSEITLQSEEEFTPVIPAKPKESGKVEKADNSHLEIASLREENARLSRALSEQRRSFETRQSEMDGAAVSELREKLEAARMENETLRGELSQISAKGNQAAAATAAATAATSKDTAQLAKLNETVRALEQENQTLKNQIEIYASSKGKADANADVLAKLQAENADLKQVVASLKAQQSEASATAATSTSMDAEMNKLRADNRKMNNELDLARAENADLQKRAASLQKDVENKQLKMSGGSWDLEQATRRYQESQREIVRLGSLLQAQDVKCANEKKDIEYMLFDPTIATKAQISMLNSMEDQIKERDEKLRAAEDALQSTKVATQESPEKDARIAELERAVADAKAQIANQSQQLAEAQNKIGQAEAVRADSQAVKASVDAQSKDIAALKAELDHKTKALTDAEAKLQSVQVAQADLDGKNKALLDMQNTIAVKSQQLAEAQAKLQQLSGAQAASVSQKDTEVQTLKAQLAQTQSLLQAEQIKVEQAQIQQGDAKIQAQQAAQAASQVASQAAMISNLQAQVKQANQKVIQLQNQISTTNSAALRAASIAPAAAPVVAQALPAYQAPTNTVSNASYSAPTAQATATKFKSAAEFSTLLKNAGVNVRGDLQQIKGGDPSSYRAYSWKTDSLYGSAEMKKVADENQFDAGVNQYLSRAKSRCEGEFAAVPSPVKAAGVEKSKAYEIACVGQGASSSASVLFTYGNHIATTVAHEGRAEAMDLAIDARDKVSSKIN